jgi:hypothetical protein
MVGASDNCGLVSDHLPLFWRGLRRLKPSWSVLACLSLVFKLTLPLFSTQTVVKTTIYLKIFTVEVPYWLPVFSVVCTECVLWLDTSVHWSWNITVCVRVSPNQGWILRLRSREGFDSAPVAVFVTPEGRSGFAVWYQCKTEVPLILA